MCDPTPRATGNEQETVTKPESWGYGVVRKQMKIDMFTKLQNMTDDELKTYEKYFVSNIMVLDPDAGIGFGAGTK